MRIRRSGSPPAILGMHRHRASSGSAMRARRIAGTRPSDRWRRAIAGTRDGHRARPRPGCRCNNQPAGRASSLLGVDPGSQPRHEARQEFVPLMLLGAAESGRSRSPVKVDPNDPARSADHPTARATLRRSEPADGGTGRGPIMAAAQTRSSCSDREATCRRRATSRAGDLQPFAGVGPGRDHARPAALRRSVSRAVGIARPTRRTDRHSSPTAGEPVGGRDATARCTATRARPRAVT